MSGFIIDTPEGIEAFAALQAFYALKLEVETGLRHSRGSVMKLIKQRYGIEGNTKKVVLENYKHFLQDAGILHSVKS